MPGGSALKGRIIARILVGNSGRRISRRDAEEQRRREAEKQKSRKASEQRSRGAEERRGGI